MRFLISYFYQIRFFEKYMIPFSTAKWDPKWFHRNGETFFDSHGVINGLRLDVLSAKNDECHGRAGCDPNDYGHCTFLQEYSSQLHNIDFSELVDYCQNVAHDIQQIAGFNEEPVIVLLVYETPDNPCSERVPLQQWFSEHGYALDEFIHKK